MCGEGKESATNDARGEEPQLFKARNSQGVKCTKASCQKLNRQGAREIKLLEGERATCSRLRTCRYYGSHRVSED